MRASNGQLVFIYSKADLYSLVALAARTVKPYAPQSLSVREFDRSLAEIGYPDAPSGRAIYGRLKRPWPQIVELALRERNATRADDAVTRKDEAPWLTERHLFFAMKTIARFKEAESIPESLYNGWREEYLAANPLNQPRELLEQLLPTGSQIVRIAVALDAEGETPWKKALAFVGLGAPKTKSNAGMPIAEAMGLYVDATGGRFAPSIPELERLRVEWGIAIANKTLPWGDYLAECRAHREERGLTMPTTYAKPDARPPLVKPADLEAPPAQPGKGHWSENLIEERLTHYVLDCRSKGGRPRQKHYGQWRKTRPGYPSASTVGRHGDFIDWVEKIEARLLAEKKAA